MFTEVITKKVSTKNVKFMTLLAGVLVHGHFNDIVKMHHFFNNLLFS